MADAPVSDAALFEREALLDPYPTYKALRDLGRVVWLERYGMFVLTHYSDVKHALEDWQTYSSAGGVSMNDVMNEKLKGGLLCSDPPRHDALRRVIERPLLPKALAELRQTVADAAERVVADVCARRTFDAATELAPYLPVTIVSELVGLPDDGRERMLVWAAANFESFGPINARTEAAFPILGEMIQYAFTQCVPGKLKPDGWAQRIWDAAHAGEVSLEDAPYMMNDYMGPSLDTTIFGLSSAIWLFARHPDQWQVVRQNPALLPQAINEVMRLESPIQNFSRYVVKDAAIGDVTMPAGSRTIISYGSANRDERHWGNGDAFDVMRKGSQDHLAFGLGEHNCVGQNLARMEMRAVLAALAKRVERFELHEVERDVNNTLRGLKHCVVTVH